MPAAPDELAATPTIVAVVRAGESEPGGRAVAAVAAGADMVEVEAGGEAPATVAHAVRAVRAAVGVPVGVTATDGSVVLAAIEAGADGARVPGAATAETFERLAASGAEVVLVLGADDHAVEAAARAATDCGIDPRRLAFDPGALDPSEPDHLATRLRALATIVRTGRRAVASPEVTDRPGLATVVALATARGASSIRTRDTATTAHAAAVTAAIGVAR